MSPEAALTLQHPRTWGNDGISKPIQFNRLQYSYCSEGLVLCLDVTNNHFPKVKSLLEVFTLLSVKMSTLHPSPTRCSLNPLQLPPSLLTSSGSPKARSPSLSSQWHVCTGGSHPGSALDNKFRPLPPNRVLPDLVSAFSSTAKNNLASHHLHLSI